jgi:glycosyltransferase involved in cell wall biosynthesis
MKNLLVIPAFNEEPCLPELVKAAKKHIQDIMVIDDGSTDATTLVAALAGAMVHRLKTNMGKGEALKTAFAYAIEQGYDRVLTMDGDGQHAPGDIVHFLPLLDQYDLILGNRMSDSGRVPLLRRVANLTSSFIVSALCGRRIYDSQTGFRVYSTDLLRRIKLQSSRYDLETEVIIKAARKGFRIGHVHIQTIYADEVSRFRNVKDSLRFLSVVFKSFLWW